MATISEIQNLLNKVEITIDEDDIKDAIELFYDGESFEKGENIEETLIKNAQYINFKKLLIIIVKRRQELLNEYKAQKISPLIEKQNEEQLKKAIKFERSYIKPEEFVKVSTLDYALGREEIIDSKTVVYGEKIEKKNKLYEKIKELLPDIEVSNFFGLLKNVLEDEKMGELQFRKEINHFMEEKGMQQKEIASFWQKFYESESEEQTEEVLQVIDKEKFNKRIKSLFESLGPYINAEKCFLFYGCCLGCDLEKRKRIRRKRTYIFRKFRKINKRC